MATSTQGCSLGKVGYSLDELEYALCPPSALRYGLWDSFTTTPLLVFTIARELNSLNPLLSNQYLDELGVMLPKNFLQHVMQVLTPSERKSLMVAERWRRKSFLAGWPHEGRPNQSKLAMVEAGFYYLGEADRVQCAFCQGILFDWEAVDLPRWEHSKYFTHCAFPRVDTEVRNRNIAYYPSISKQKHLGKVIAYGCPQSGDDTERTLIGIDLEALGISPHIGYTDGSSHTRESKRFATFSDWPDVVSGRKLAKAGFYWSYRFDIVTCFYCGIRISAWNIGDDPWAEHARWSPECAFLCNKKGRQYIENIRAETDPKKKCTKKNYISKNIEPTSAVVHVEKQRLIKEAIVKVGYDSELINQAFLKAGGCFNNASDTISMIQEIHDSNTILSGKKSGSVFRDEPRLAVQSNAIQKPKYEQGCKECERLKDTFEFATNIGLPCGHLIFCDECAAEAKTRAEEDLSKANPCPYYGCCNPLSGTMRIRT